MPFHRGMLASYESQTFHRCWASLAVHITLIFSECPYSTSLAQPDPYTGGEGLVTCYTWSCSAIAYRPAPIRLQLFCVAMVTRGRNNRALLFNIAHLLDAMIGKRAAQYKLNVTSRKTTNYCIPAGQLRV